jgi:3'-phosphoadenosine 5'-phosphosulfate sulfotransferase (PAPS reductase)/FAD synthetase
MSEPIHIKAPQPAVLFSGGRTSGFMLRKLLDAYPHYRDDYVTIFCNTGKEMPETLDFVNEVQTRWEVPIVWVEYTRKLASDIPDGIFPTARRNANLAKAAAIGETVHWYKIVTYETASRRGEPFDELLNWMTVLPNVVSRGCSIQLKIRTAMRYLFSIGLKEYASIIGIRKDESHRSIQILANCDSFEHPRFPLVEWGVTEADVIKFWQENCFDLRLKSYQGNCDLCFLKAKWKRVKLVKENPGLLGWWKGWESKKSANGETRNGKHFRLGEPYELIEQLANEKDLFDEPANSEPDIPCSCAERAFDKSCELDV